MFCLSMLSPFLQNWLRSLVLLLLCSSYAVSGYASHIYGMDLYYSHVSGNTYIVYLAAYGDCSGSAFSLLPGSTPQISIYNGNTFVSNINLSILSPSGGVEVSPVCPAQMNNTQCTNSSRGSHAYCHIG